MTQKITRWENALHKLWKRNRVHVSTDVSAAYRELVAIYSNANIIGYPTGSEAGYWVVPKSWEVEYATVCDPNGRKLVDYDECRLGLATYSPSFEGIISLAKLAEHNTCSKKYPERRIFSFRNQYRHWDRVWGVSIPWQIFKNLEEGDYKVSIKTHFDDGILEMVECKHQGELDDTFLLVGHFDHPDMCLDGLVGCLAGHEVIERLKDKKTKYSYAMLSTIEIVGSVFYAQYEAKKRGVRQAMFMACSGANAPLCYQKTSRSNSAIDQIMIHVSKHVTEHVSIANFREGPIGNDEIAFDTHAQGIPCASIMRGPYDERHTDADTPSVVNPQNFEGMVNMVLRGINILEKNAILSPQFEVLPCLAHPELELYVDDLPDEYGLPNEDTVFRQILGRLDETLEGVVVERVRLSSLMTVLCCLREGEKTTLEIAEDLDMPFELVDVYTDMWVEKKLIKKTWKNMFDN